MSYRMGITAAIMEIKNQIGSSNSNIKINMAGLSVKDIRKTMLTMKEFFERKWMNAMLLYNLKKMVANGTLIKVKDTYTLIEAETIEQTIKPLNETIKKTINSIKQTSKPSNETIKTSRKASNETIKTSNKVKHIGTGGNLHQTIKNRTCETKHIVNKGRNQQTMNKQTMHKQPMTKQQTMSKRTHAEQTMSKRMSKIK